MLTIRAIGAPVRFETSVLPAGSELVARCEVNSLQARPGDPEWVHRFPELGRFEIPRIRCQITRLSVMSRDTRHKNQNAAPMAAIE